MCPNLLIDTEDSNFSLQTLLKHAIRLLHFVPMGVFSLFMLWKWEQFNLLEIVMLPFLGGGDSFLKLILEIELLRSRECKLNSLME